jgi:hypothetical protein
MHFRFNRPGLPDHPVHGVARHQVGQRLNLRRGTPGEVPDAAGAEPVPHEHLPSRSDDNELSA